MATTTELLNPISSRNIMASRVYYQCRRPTPLTVSWPFSKRSQKRHSSSYSLFDSSVLRGEIIGTSSLPSTPIPFVTIDKDKKTFWEDIDCGDDIASSLSSSQSSGYSSGSSTEGFASDSSSLSSSSESSSRFSECTICGAEHLQPNRFIPSELSTVNVENHCKESGFEERSNKWNNVHSLSSSTSEASDSSGILTSSPLSETNVPSTTVSGSSPTEVGSSKLTSVRVASKGSSPESSLPNGLTSSEETPRQRVKDDEGFIRRAACVCVNEDESKVILISSKNEGGGWLIPGGGLESGEGEEAAAEREAWEEAGIVGSVRRCLGVFQSEDEVTHKKKRTAVYVLTVREQHAVFPEASLGRAREWFSIDSAVHQLSQCKPHQMAYLQDLLRRRSNAQ